MDYGKKIAYLRKSKGMTQHELGKELNVTYQAVSKWERGESLPDFTTMTQLAKIFQVSIDYFAEENENYQEPAYSTDESVHEPLNAVMHDYVGVCTECGKMLDSDEVYSSSPKIICKNCAERHKQIQLINKKNEETRKEVQRQAALGKGFDVKLIVILALSFITYIVMAVFSFSSGFDSDSEFKSVLLFLVQLAVFGCTNAVFDFINDLRAADDSDYKRNLSLIIAGVFSAVNLITYLVIYLLSKESFYLGIMVLAVVLSFTFVSQVLWGGVVKEIFTAGGFTFKMPGFIFSLNIDSILWMIAVKIVLGIVAIALFIITTILFALVAIFGSVITFIPSIISKTIKDKTA
ncbi:MAG: helix-turn-helix domain-containing protein [Clostridia bacterium]|nr:helix-turn-helix domain-containing protein [Clostridia bacterium]